MPLKAAVEIAKTHPGSTASHRTAPSQDRRHPTTDPLRGQAGVPGLLRLSLECVGPRASMAIPRADGAWSDPYNRGRRRLDADNPGPPARGVPAFHRSFLTRGPVPMLSKSARAPRPPMGSILAGPGLCWRASRSRQLRSTCLADAPNRVDVREVAGRRRPDAISLVRPVKGWGDRRRLLLDGMPDLQRIQPDPQGDRRGAALRPLHHDRGLRRPRRSRPPMSPGTRGNTA